MPSALLDNTYVVFGSQGTALAWPAGARIAQVRILALDTTASAVFQVVAGTSIFEWRYLVHELGVGTSARSIQTAMHVFPMGGVGFKTAWIPTTLTACTAWIDFL